MAKFCKSKGCPSSQQVLAFQTGNIDAGSETKIRQHIADCDFCAAEADFYASYPQDEVQIKPAEIPKPLFELAEALLTKRSADDHFLSLMKDVSLI